MIEGLTLLTQEDAAKLVRCSCAKLARERRLGRLAYIPGRPVLIKMEDLLDWLDRRRVAAGPKAAKTNRNQRLRTLIVAQHYHTNTKRQGRS